MLRLDMPWKVYSCVFQNPKHHLPVGRQFYIVRESRVCWNRDIIRHRFWVEFVITQSPILWFCSPHTYIQDWHSPIVILRWTVRSESEHASDRVSNLLTGATNGVSPDLLPTRKHSSGPKPCITTAEVVGPIVRNRGKSLSLYHLRGLQLLRNLNGCWNRWLKKA